MKVSKYPIEYENKSDWQTVNRSQKLRAGGPPEPLHQISCSGNDIEGEKRNNYWKTYWKGCEDEIIDGTKTRQECCRIMTCGGKHEWLKKNNLPECDKYNENTQPQFSLKKKMENLTIGIL